MKVSRPAVLEPLEVRVFMSTVTFQQGVNGYAGTQDTYVSQSAPDSAFGNASFMDVDLDASTNSGNQPTQGLLRFENIFGTGASQVPAGSTITSATLTLYTGTDISSTNT